MDSVRASFAMGADAILLCRTRARLCALPLVHVVETMRPLAIEPFGGGPEFVLGLSRIRGAHVPVIDLGRLLGLPGEKRPTRFVVLRVDGRSVAVRVEAVIGVSTLSAERALALPPLLNDAADGPVAALAARDAELLVVLKAASLLPSEDGMTGAKGEA